MTDLSWGTADFAPYEPYGYARRLPSQKLICAAALLLSVPLGIVAYFLVPALLPLLLMTTSWLREHAGWLDLGTAQTPLLEQGWLTGQQWAQLGTTSAIWMLLPLVVGCWRVARREVR